MRVCSPPTSISSRRETEQLCGGLETYYERSLRSKYRSQGLQTSFYESTPSPTNSLGDQISTGSSGNFGHAGTNFPYAPKERDNGGASDSPGFYSNVFLVRKASGGWRPVIDLKNLNAQIHAPHFRMFTTSSVLSSVKKGDYAFKIDLQDVYFHVPIHSSSRKYLRFAFENRVYQFQVLPFGLNTAPQIFTRLGHTVTAYLHCQGISVIPYLDDWLIHHPDCQVLLRHQALLLYARPCRLHSESKEIRTGPDSGSPVPRNSLTFGPRESFTPGVQSWGDSCLRTPSVLPRGTKLHSSVPASGVTQLALRSYLSVSFVPETSSTSFSFVRSDRPVYATASIRPIGPCQPTSAMAGPTFSYLRNPDPPISGGLYDFHGFSLTDRKLHINSLEFKAVTFALQHWAPLLQGRQVMVATDNSTVVSYINKQGGTRSSTLLRLTVDLFLWLESQSIIVRARHIPGCLNVIADHLSRPNQPIPTEWSLHPEIVSRIFRVWGTPEVDMFATPSSVHVSSSGAKSPSGGCSVSNWQGRSMYMFPPFPLLNKVMQKLWSTQVAEVILVAPWWPSQSWFPHLLRLCVEHPLVLPYRRDLLSQQDQKYISDGKSYHLHV